MRETVGEFIRQPDETAKDWIGLINAPFNNHLEQQKAVRDLALQLNLCAGTRLAKRFTCFVGSDAKDE